MSAHKPGPLLQAAFGPWASAHFPTEATRDRFLCDAATLPTCDVEVAPMLDEVRGALVRWHPGQFLRLNDIAYAHGGRIIVDVGRGHPGS